LLEIRAHPPSNDSVAVPNDLHVRVSAMRGNLIERLEVFLEEEEAGAAWEGDL